MTGSWNPGHLCIRPACEPCLVYCFKRLLFFRRSSYLDTSSLVRRAVAPLYIVSCLVAPTGVGWRNCTFVWYYRYFSRLFICMVDVTIFRFNLSFVQLQVVPCFSSGSGRCATDPYEPTPPAPSETSTTHPLPEMSCMGFVSLFFTFQPLNLGCDSSSLLEWVCSTGFIFSQELFCRKWGVSLFPRWTPKRPRN